MSREGDVISELHALAMNSPRKDYTSIADDLYRECGTSVFHAYKCGHRDARHAIAQAIVGHEGLRAALRARPAAENAGWVSVKECLPPDGVQVLIAAPKWETGVRFGKWWEDIGEWRTEGCNYAEHVTHWMPLPTRPEATA